MKALLVCSFRSRSASIWHAPASARCRSQTASWAPVKAGPHRCRYTVLFGAVHACADPTVDLTWCRILHLQEDFVPAGSKKGYAALVFADTLDISTAGCSTLKISYQNQRNVHKVCLTNSASKDIFTGLGCQGTLALLKAAAMRCAAGLSATGRQSCDANWV